jgi:hypothetical protein
MPTSTEFGVSMRHRIVLTIDAPPNLFLHQRMIAGSVKADVPQSRLEIGRQG